MQLRSFTVATALILLVLNSPAFSQQGVSGTDTDLEFRSSILGSSQGALPFWLHSNRDGTVDSSGVNWINEIRLHRMLLERNDFSLQTGGRLVGRLSGNSSAHFNELYLHAEWKGYRLSAGRFADPIGLNNHDLSIGSMMVSRNATPVPKISISTPDFLNVPLTDGHLQYKGMFSHGWLEESRFVSSALLHQKYFYLRLNVGPFSGTGGLVHNVTWGGTHPRFGSFSPSFGDFLRVVTGQAADSSSNAANIDKSNVIGNSIGAYDFGLEFHHEHFTASLTRLFYLEDRVSTRFRSPWDGVWGFNFNMKDKDHWISGLTYEHINTIQQDAKPGQGRGRAIYYHNDAYQSGWTYNRQVIGLPLILFNPEQLYDEQNINFKNNMIIGHHLGVRGSIAGPLTYTLFATYTRNYGHNPDRLPPEELNRPQKRTDQYSLNLDLAYQLPAVDGLSVTFTVAGDFGELYENNAGLGIGLSWRVFGGDQVIK